MTEPTRPDTVDLLEPVADEVSVGSPERRIALVDLLDRVLAGGVVLTGEIRLCIADVDLVHVSLRALITSVGTLNRGGRP
ncbi:gas vesicle protein [Saccharomonospora azurea]|uniref:Gas vesicle protein n=1 Tax=Saccharomonospora azurea NA-128 TaxID=882081 RepID=H8G5B6_9PSEU|nr:Gas vesicle protein [Saccharomonospora azurea NA-128]